MIEPSLTEQRPGAQLGHGHQRLPARALRGAEGGHRRGRRGVHRRPVPGRRRLHVRRATSLPGFPVDSRARAGRRRRVSTCRSGRCCTVVETDSVGASTVTYDPPAPSTARAAQAQVPADGTLTATVTITNDFVTGSLVIEKTVSGPGAPAFSGGPFQFDVTCDYLGNEDVFSTTVVVAGSDDGSPVAVRSRHRAADRRRVHRHRDRQRRRRPHRAAHHRHHRGERTGQRRVRRDRQPVLGRHDRGRQGGRRQRRREPTT